MSTKREIKVKFSPIQVDREFIQNLGEIIEKQKEERIKKAENKINYEISETKKEFEDLDFFSEEKKAAELYRSIDNIKHMNKPLMNHVYTLNSKNESLEFKNYKDILNTSFLPNNIESMVIRVNHYDEENFVDITINLQNPQWGFTLELSSCNEEKMLLIKEKITRLFSQRKVNYPGLFTKESFQYLFSIFIGIVTILLLFLAGNFFFEKMESIVIFGVLFIIYYPIAIFFPKILSYLFPYVEFRLGVQKTTARENLRKAFWIIISGIIIAGLYDLIRLLI